MPPTIDYQLQGFVCVSHLVLEMAAKTAEQLSCLLHLRTASLLQRRLFLMSIFFGRNPIFEKIHTLLEL